MVHPALALALAEARRELPVETTGREDEADPVGGSPGVREEDESGKTLRLLIRGLSGR